MKTYPVLFEYAGENCGTAPDPRREFTAADSDILSEKKTFCSSWDDDSLVQGPRYCVRTVDLPDWLPVSEWVRRYSEFSFLWAEIGPAAAADFPEVWQRGLLEISGIQRTLVIELLKTKKFRSEFRRSLRDQAVDWLERINLEMSGYTRPFSRRQIETAARYTRPFRDEVYYNYMQYHPADGVKTGFGSGE